MNKFIKKELDKIKEVNIIYDDNTTDIYIPQKIGIKLEEDHYYIIKLSDNMLYPSPNSIIVTNWNNNSIPNSRYYKVDVSKIMSNMVKVNGVAYDFDNNIDLNMVWSGWIPIEDMEIIKKL